MFQNHPLNANGKLLRRFYEPLVLLSVLDPTRGAHRPDLITDRGFDEEAKLWRDFVDQLSFVCDFEKGGDTVTAIAAQQTVEAPIFWLASNSNSREKARGHLLWIFDRLNCFYAASPTPVAQLKDEITARCVEFSYDKIKIYSRWLLQAIKRVKCETEGTMSHEDKVLFKGLERFERLQTDFHLMCAFAYSFRRSESMEILCKRHNAHSSRGVWSDIRHCIGRLGCWTKAIKILICGAQTFPRRIENAQVEVIGSNGLADLPSMTHTTDLRSVVYRMLHADQATLAEKLSQILEDTDAVAQIESRFREDYANIKPRPHAELLVLEHFRSNGFSFVADDKYIGCSKPSCYCCNAYIQCHPGGFTPRPCHGNLWINWAPPIPLPVVTIENRQGGPIARPQEHHTFQMLQRMVVRIREDLQEQILSRRPKRERQPDSTTGMSSVIHEIYGSTSALAYIAENPVQQIEHYSAREYTPSEKRDGTNIGSDVAEDGASEPPLENAYRENDNHLFSKWDSIAKKEQSGKYEDNSLESNDGRAQLIQPEIGIGQCSMTRQTNFSDDDDEDNGGVLLFKGRRDVPS